jgi:hypothetical protein
MDKARVEAFSDAVIVISTGPGDVKRLSLAMFRMAFFLFVCFSVMFV